ncbi:MAG: mechanosensitive ion channel [Bacteroidetes bacterium]|nr:mechanosensitive ion channel [Bacteroidota bacterium]
MVNNLLSSFDDFILDLFNWTASGTNLFWAKIIAVLCIFLFAFACNKGVRYILFNFVSKFIKSTKTNWDDIFLNQKVLIYLSKLMAPIIIYYLIPTALDKGEFLYELLRRFSLIYIVYSCTWLVNGFLSATYIIYSTREKYRDRPLKGLLQTAQVILIIISAVVIISIFIGKSPLVLLTAMGASAAVMMLLFKDSIMGFVAGIQLAANDMVKVGDWVTMPKYGADGNIIEVTLTTVKVQNFDNTIITVPPYALVTESLQNWKGMAESGGRRVMRSVSIDQTSIKFCDSKMIEEFGKIDLLKDYIDNKQTEFNNYNEKNSIDSSVLVNGKRQTNLGVFRAYLDNYLKDLSAVNHEMTCMVRQLSPNEKGIPIQLYFFSAIKDWPLYEAVQADVFDHVLAIVPLFNLRVFQLPTGADFESLKKL